MSTTDATRDHRRVSDAGRDLGEQVVRLVEPIITRMAALGIPDTRCKSCAFRPGTIPNGCAQTQMDAAKACLERVPFMCHSHVDANGRHNVVCHGWFATQVATASKPPMKLDIWGFSPSDELIESLAADGYTDVVRFAKTLAGLHRFNFTTGLVVGLSSEGYERRYCFEHESDARAALNAWDGEGHPSGPWIKCKGIGVDLLNPELQA